MSGLERTETDLSGQLADQTAALEQATAELGSARARVTELEAEALSRSEQRCDHRT